MGHVSFLDHYSMILKHLLILSDHNNFISRFSEINMIEVPEHNEKVYPKRPKEQNRPKKRKQNGFEVIEESSQGSM